MERKNFDGEDLLRLQRASFDPAEGYLILELDLQSFYLHPEGVQYERRHFEAKDEVHITILSRDAAEAVRQHLERYPQDEEQVRQLVDETNMDYRKLDSFYHIQEEPEVETIVQMVEVPGVGTFFKQVGQLVGQELELPPTHVTLYMRGTEKGIGIPTQAEFERLAQKQIRLEELKTEQGN
jgi:ribosomal protein S15P/S13E